MVNKSRIEWRMQVAVIIRKLLEKHPISENSTDVHTDAPFFNDYYEFVGLRYDLQQFADTLEQMCKYENMCQGLEVDNSL